MNTTLRIATAFAAGAAIMYCLDPAVGRRRRALIRDKGIAAGHEVENYARAKSRRAVNRIQGAAARTRASLTNAPVGDQKLHDRVRARLGRLVDRSGEVKVDVQDGHVVLRGSATAAEIEDVIETIASMRGVAGIDNRLSPDDGYEAFSSVPG